MLRTCAGLAAGGLLAACVPSLKEPPHAIDTMAVPSHSGAAPAAKPLAPDWWTLFGNAQLNQLLATATTGNPGLAEATARVEAAQQEVLRADASRSIHLDSGAKVTRVHNSRNGDRAIYNGETYNLGDLNLLSVNYHLDLWGQDRATIAIAEADAQVAAARHDQAALLLDAAVIKTYFAWHTAERLRADAQALADLADDASRIKCAAVDSGIAPAAEQVAQDQQADAARARLAELTQRRDALRYSMLALLGRGPDDGLQLAGDDAAAPQDLPLPAHIGLDQLSARPDIRIARWSAQSALHQEELAKTAYYPNVNLRAMIGLTSIGLPDLLRASSIGLAVGPAINLPLFEGGALDASLRGKAAAHAAAVQAYNKAVLDAAAEVATDLAALDNQHNRLTELAAAHAAAGRYSAMAETKYRSGVSDRLEAVQARQKEMNAAMDELGAKLNWLYAITDTETDLGGGLQGDGQEAAN